MKIRIYSMLKKSQIEHVHPDALSELEKWGFKWERKKPLLHRGQEYIYVTGMEPEDENDLPFIEKEFESVEAFLAFADKNDSEFVYNKGEWTLFNDPYYYV